MDLGGPDKEFRQHTYSASPGEATGQYVRCSYSFFVVSVEVGDT